MFQADCGARRSPQVQRSAHRLADIGRDAGFAATPECPRVPERREPAKGTPECHERRFGRWRAVNER